MDVRSIIALHGDYSTAEPFIDWDWDGRVQKIGYVYYIVQVVYLYWLSPKGPTIEYLNAWARTGKATWAINPSLKTTSWPTNSKCGLTRYVYFVWLNLIAIGTKLFNHSARSYSVVLILLAWISFMTGRLANTSFWSLTTLVRILWTSYIVLEYDTY